jgi:hypothetical protein
MTGTNFPIVLDEQIIETSGNERASSKPTAA